MAMGELLQGLAFDSQASLALWSFWTAAPRKLQFHFDFWSRCAHSRVELCLQFLMGNCCNVKVEHLSPCPKNDPSVVVHVYCIYTHVHQTSKPWIQVSRVRRWHCHHFPGQLKSRSTDESPQGKRVGMGPGVCKNMQTNRNQSFDLLEQHWRYTVEGTLSLGRFCLL